MRIEQYTQEGLGIQTRYLAAGSGPPLVLLHALGENATDWRWIMPLLAGTHRIYAPDLPSVGPWRGPQADYSPSFFGRFLAGFLDALGLEQSALVGNSLGGLTALYLALADPDRVSSITLMGSGGLGREISPALRAMTPPGVGEASIAWGRTPIGAMQRAWGRSGLLFAHPLRVPRPWILEQYRLAQQADFLPATLATLRAQVDLGGQRNIVSSRLSELHMPALLLWGESDLVVPIEQAQHAAERLPQGHLTVIPGAGHVPQVEHPDLVADRLHRFLTAHA